MVKRRGSVSADCKSDENPPPHTTTLRLNDPRPPVARRFTGRQEFPDTRLDWRSHRVRELVVALVRYSVSRSGPADPAEQMLAVVLASVAVGEVAVERVAFGEQG